MTEVEAVQAACDEAAALLRTMAAERADAVARAATVIGDALARGGKVLVCGNGGSAADAGHFAAELVGRFRRDRRGLAAIALTTDAAVVTSVANDYGFERVFARQVEALARGGDVVVAVTTSGRSANVNDALAAARACEATTVALTGRDGGGARALADVEVHVPSDDTARIQEVHRLVLHVVCELVEARLA